MSQGIVSPYSRYDIHSERVEFDYTWAIGDHPFGPFASSPKISNIFVQALRRNAVLSRVHSGVSIIRDTIGKIDNFAEVNFFFFF